ncbi:MAG: exodeoxyribonuclease VII large subunit [Candidatus Azobacteroides sp.]|nr:exodeoxyribonuclease VII large subunit [Candidatus Azobacteroides sp.]
MSDGYLSLSEVNALVKNVIRGNFPDLYWIRVEISEMKINASGHCYLEFVEKDPYSGYLLAKAQGRIWGNTFRMLRLYFEKETGQTFKAGLKVLIRVSIDFHEIYGYSLTVSDIDPAFTLGDLMQQRAAVLKQLEADGVLTLNRELTLPSLPKRIAVISSETASGYEDFVNQLKSNGGRFNFYVKIFPALMQGIQTEESVIGALNNIYDEYEQFDVVVIIRGGGAVSDLNCFDGYLLAANCAQFPLPIITGIGHEKDNSVVDMVAHTRVKTPTAAAEFLIDKMVEAENNLLSVENAVFQCADKRLVFEKNRLMSVCSKIPLYMTQMHAKYKLQLERISRNIQASVENYFIRQKHQLQLSEQVLKSASPEHILKKGYTLTLKDGKIIKSATGLQKGERITTRFYDGNIESVVENDGMECEKSTW